jgi:hypothetical protein
MPDLTNQAYWQCRTAEAFEIKVFGDSGVEYMVRYGRAHKHETDVEFEWSCTCPAYYHRPGHCKHIKRVIADKRRCGWMQFLDGGEPVEKDGQKVCPRCNQPLDSRVWGV